MNKQSVLSILRSVLTAVGAYVAGKSFLGNTIDDNLWLGIGSSIVTLASIVWGILDKTATLEMFESGLRSVIMFVGALLVGAGIIKDEVLQSLLAISSVAIPAIYSQLSKTKSKNIAEGTLGVADLAGVKPEEVKPINPVVETPKK